MRLLQFDITAAGLGFSGLSVLNWLQGATGVVAGGNQSVYGMGVVAIIVCFWLLRREVDRILAMGDKITKLELDVANLKGQVSNWDGSDRRKREE